MTKITGNEPSMPKIVELTEAYNMGVKVSAFNVFSDGGLTIRQEFAARAMQGILSSAPYGMISFKDVIVSSVELADALINELNNTL